MKNILRFTIILLATLNASSLFAQTIIVPATEVSVETYLERCHKEGYVCGHEFMTEKLISTATPEFDQLINQLDLLNEDQRKKLPTDIISILKNELISVDQLNALMQMCEKALSLDKSLKLDFILKELTEVYQAISSVTEKENESTVFIVFKKRLTQNQFDKLKYKIQNYKYYKVDPFQLSERNQNEVLFVSGTCQKKYISPLITKDLVHQQVYPLFQNDCASDFNFQTSVKSVSEFTSKNKNTILWTLAAVGAAFFANNYNIEFK